MNNLPCNSKHRRPAQKCAGRLSYVIPAAGNFYVEMEVLSGYNRLIKYMNLPVYYMNTEYKVSVFCTAYNHKPYIAETLESFLSQKTDFPFEVLVTDDASTDGTTDVLYEYAEKYPDVIRFFHQEENRFSRGGNLYEEVMYPNARGKYIAYCEGDDYWCDSTKLQQQVDFLEANPDYSACVHNSLYRFCNSDRADESLVPSMGDHDVPFSTIILGMSHCFHTSSILGKAEYICHPPEFQSVAFRTAGFTDYPLSLNLAMNGKIHFIDLPMSVYRVNSNPDSWKSGYDDSYIKKTRFVNGEIAMMKSMLPVLSGENLSLTEKELLKREYELLYLEGDVDSMTKPPYDVLYRQEPLSFRAKTTVKKLFPALHEKYRKKQGYK